MPNQQLFARTCLTGAFLLLAGSLAGAQTSGQPTNPPSEQQGTLSQIENALRGYLQQGKDALSNLDTVLPYQLPEVLPNGDIIIRRNLGTKAGTDTPGTPAPAPAAPQQGDKDGTKT